MGMTVFKQTDTHSASNLSEETPPGTRLVCPASVVCLVSLCKAHCCLLRTVASLVRTPSPKPLPPSWPESHCSDRKEARGRRVTWGHPLPHPGFKASSCPTVRATSLTPNLPPTPPTAPGAAPSLPGPQGPFRAADRQMTQSEKVLLLGLPNPLLKIF